MDSENMIPVHPRGDQEKDTDKWFKVRNVLNIIFMLGAIAGVSVYFLTSHTVGTFIILASIIFKIAECCLRLLRQ